jgi:hypothetical protein
LTDLEVRPRLVREARTYQGANSRYLGLVDRNRAFGDPDDGNKAGCLHYRQSILGVEPTEEITGEQRKFDFLNSIRPAPLAPITRKKPLIPVARKESCNSAFMVRSNVYGKPWQTLCFATRTQRLLLHVKNINSPSLYIGLQNWLISVPGADELSKRASP